MTNTPETALVGLAADLFPLHCALFELSLRRAATSDSSWQERMKSFKHLSMLEFLVVSPFKPKPLIIDESKLDDYGYRRSLIRKLKLPRPSKWSRHELKIDRQLICSNDAYRKEAASYLTYKWLGLLSPLSDDPAVLLPIIKMTADELDHSLDSLALNQIDAEAVSKLLLTRLAYILVENNSTYQAVCQQLKSDFAEISAKTRAEIAVIGQATMKDFSARLDVHLAEINRQADETISSIRENLQKSRERIDAVLAEAKLEEQTR